MEAIISSDVFAVAFTDLALEVIHAATDWLAALVSLPAWSQHWDVNLVPAAVLPASVTSTTEESAWSWSAALVSLVTSLELWYVDLILLVTEFPASVPEWPVVVVLTSLWSAAVLVALAWD